MECDYPQKQTLESVPIGSKVVEVVSPLLE
jgi:hypothetical protein